jgi:hypothetical protein
VSFIQVVGVLLTPGQSVIKVLLNKNLTLECLRRLFLYLTYLCLLWCFLAVGFNLSNSGSKSCTFVNGLFVALLDQLEMIVVS